jgi:hypothetical protein
MALFERICAEVGQGTVQLELGALIKYPRHSGSRPAWPHPRTHRHPLPGRLCLEAKGRRGLTADTESSQQDLDNDFVGERDASPLSRGMAQAADAPANSARLGTRSGCGQGGWRRRLDGERMLRRHRPQPLPPGGVNRRAGRQGIAKLKRRGRVLGVPSTAFRSPVPRPSCRRRGPQERRQGLPPGPQRIPPGRAVRFGC